MTSFRTLGALIPDIYYTIHNSLPRLIDFISAIFDINLAYNEIDTRTLPEKDTAVGNL